MSPVTYTLMVNGSAAPPTVMSTIQQLEVEDHARMADILRLRVLMSSKPSAGGWSVLDDSVFSRLTRLDVKVKVGSGTQRPLITAYVIESHAKFSNTPGDSYMDVVGMDPTILMNLDEKVRSWPNMSYSDIANQVCNAYGFTPDVDTVSISYEESDTTITQRDTDIRFLTKLAQHCGFECFVELNDSSGDIEGHFHKPRLSDKTQGVLSVNLGEATNVNNFSARYHMLQPVQAQASSVDVYSSDTQDAQADTSSLKTLGKQGAADPNKPRQVLVSQSGLTQTAELANYTQAIVDRSAFAIIAEGELNTVAYGDLLQAKSTVEVRGAGKQFSGLYYVERVRHHFTGDDYIQKFTMLRNATGVSTQDDFAENNALPN